MKGYTVRRDFFTIICVDEVFKEVWDLRYTRRELLDEFGDWAPALMAGESIERIYPRIGKVRCIDAHCAAVRVVTL